MVFGWHGDSVKDYAGGLVGTVDGTGTSIGNVEGYVGGGTRFNQDVSDQDISFGTTNLFTNTSYTVSLWAKDENCVHDSLFNTRMISGTSTGQGAGFSIGTSTVSTTGLNRTRFVHLGAGVGIDAYHSSSFWCDWHMFTGVLNGTTNAMLYEDGVLVDTDSAVSLDSNYVTDFMIGRRYLTTQIWNGTVDEVHVWSRALDGGEINQLYNNTVASYNASWSDVYYTPNGSANSIQNLTEPYRYIQYRSLFETLDGNFTPKLTDSVLKQIDYQTKILNAEPYSNFSLLYPKNNMWINDNTTVFNVTNGSDLDADNLLFSILIYNSTNPSILHLTNKTYNNYTLASSEQLIDGNYTWKARLFDNSTTYDNIYENLYSDWVGNFEFYLDTHLPSMTLVNQTVNRTEGEIFINETSFVTTGENLTLRFNLTDTGSPITSAWIKIWQTVKDGVLLFFGWLTHVTGDLWEITIPAINYTYPAGQINYTIYANDTANNVQEYDGNFTVEYNTTLDVFFNYTNIASDEGVKFIINYNYTNNTVIKNANVNITVSNVFYSTTYDNSLEYYYNDTVGIGLTTNPYTASVNASHNNSYYAFKNNITSFNVYGDVPIISIWNYPLMDAHMLYNNYTEFDWGDSFGHTDSDIINYELEIYNSTLFDSDSLIFAFNSTYSNYTLVLESMPTVGNYYIRYRANDSVEYNSYNYTNFSVVYSTLNIMSPSDNQILRKNTQF
ncbi:LamG domain-containing protein [Candidatus Woesearchaeota archaeon]|nr:LamG domain-containing protein [Candidatus Woesearchaeota archaeon]